MAWRQSKGSIHQKRISLDYVKNKLASTARDMTEKAKEYGQYVQHKAQEVAQGQGSWIKVFGLGLGLGWSLLVL